MSNSPMCGVAAGYHAAGAWTTMDMDCAEIQRKRDALRSYLAVLEEARRRLEEIQHDAGGAFATEDESSDTAGAGSDDDFYPLDVDDDDDEAEHERPEQWQDQVCRQMVYRRQQDNDDHVGELMDSGDNHDHNLDDSDDGDEISRDILALGLHVPHIQHSGTATPPPFTSDDSGDGFGAVPASAAAIAGLGEHMYDGSPSSSGSGSGGGGSMCVICMREYKKGRRLRVMPCAYKHRFHGRCIREWLSRSNLCPLCRHALPTAAAPDAAAQGQGGGGAGVRSRCRALVVRMNVNPY